MKIQESIFTFKTDDGEGGYLLYNSAIGTDSFCHISSSEVPYYNNFLNLDTDIDTITNSKLYKKGIIVPKNKNEVSFLKSLYVKTIGSSELVLIINPTEECNFRCKYCYESFKNSYMDSRTINKLIDYVEANIRKYTGLKVMWFGGEPLLGMPVIRKLSEAFIDICKKSRKPYSAQMTTNGFLLDYELFVELVKYKVQLFQITMDGIREIHDSQRVDINGRGTFDIILNNLLAIRNGRKLPVHILLRTNFTIKLYDRLDEYIREFCSLFADDSRFSIDIHLAGNWLGKAKESILDDLAEVNLFRKIYDKVLNHPVGIKNLSTIFMNPGGRICMSARQNTLLVSSNGDIHKCTLIFENPKSKLGDVFGKGKSFKINESKASEWIAEYNYCKCANECYLAPLCLGEHCPLLRIKGELCEGNCSCPELKVYLDIFMKCIHRFHPFEPISVLQLLKSN